MQRKLALQLLQSILPEISDDGAAVQLFRELQLLADYKYNKYEMYHAGRLFLENLYLWLHHFEPKDRLAALEFVRRDLIFVSRGEFHQLGHILYNSEIRKQQFQLAAEIAGLPRYRLREIRESKAFERVSRASLYVGMSDGARLDVLRRHNLSISNEQVLPYYEVREEKARDCLQELRSAVGDPSALFKCLFLVDDFAGSGSTLLREVVSESLPKTWKPPAVPAYWRSRLRFKSEPSSLELLWRGDLTAAEIEDLKSIDPDPRYQAAVRSLVERSSARNTTLKGSICRVLAGPISTVLDPDARVFFCPLLTTKHASERLERLFPRLRSPFSSARILSGATLGEGIAIKDGSTPIGQLCEAYYDAELGDEHTGDVKFGYDGCGLPLVLHHNTPNNSIYLLWARKSSKVSPLFVRYERHGREVS